MSVSNVRKGITQARFNENQSNILYKEILLISIVVGCYYQNWLVFGGVLTCLILVMFIPVLNLLLAIVLSLIWALIGFGIGSFFSDNASYVLTFLGLISGIGCHLSAIEWSRDLSDTEDRNL